MAARKTKSAAHLSEVPSPKSYSEELGLVHPTIPGSELLKSAEALKEILDYVEQQAETCKFRDLSLFVRTARIAGTELMHALNKNRGED